MKVFDFHCNNCSSQFEKFVNNNDVIQCDDCGSTDVTKLIGGAKFISRQSNLMSKVPGGFKSILNHQAKQAGSLNKIDTGGLGEI